MLRIDQIWASHALDCVDAVSPKCPKTDHKLYTAALKLNQPSQIAGE